MQGSALANTIVASDGEGQHVSTMHSAPDSLHNVLKAGGSVLPVIHEHHTVLFARAVPLQTTVGEKNVSVAFRQHTSHLTYGSLRVTSRLQTGCSESPFTPVNKWCDVHRSGSLVRR